MLYFHYEKYNDNFYRKILKIAWLGINTLINTLIVCAEINIVCKSTQVDKLAEAFVAINRCFENLKKGN